MVSCDRDEVSKTQSWLNNSHGRHYRSPSWYWNFQNSRIIDGPLELLPLRGKIDTYLTRNVLLKISEKHQGLMEKHWRTCSSANKYYKTNFTELMSDASFCFVIHYNNIMLFQTIFMTYTFKLLCKQFCLQPFSQKDSVSYSLLSSLPL